MDGIIKYCIVKKYKGLFRRHPSNTHLFFIPVDPKKYMYLALIGKMTDDEDNLYASQLLVKLSEDIFEETLNGEIEYLLSDILQLIVSDSLAIRVRRSHNSRL